MLSPFDRRQAGLKLRLPFFRNNISQVFHRHFTGISQDCEKAAIYHRRQSCRMKHQKHTSHFTEKAFA